MPPAVVHVLEVVHVEHEESQAGIRAARTRHLVAQRLLQEAAVVQAGERIADRLFAQFLAQALGFVEGLLQVRSPLLHPLLQLGIEVQEAFL